MIRRLILLIMVLLISPSVAKAQSCGFAWGISITWPQYLTHCDASFNADEIGKIKEAINETKKLGGRWFRMHLVWRDIEPNIEEPYFTTIDDIDGDPVDGDAVDDYLKKTKDRWLKYDEIVDYAYAKGINIVFILGTGFVRPYNFLPNHGILPISVDFHENLYKASLYRHVRAAVRKYKNKVKLWQLENELNTAGNQANPILPLWYWRDGIRWTNFTFLKSLLQNMSQAVKEEDPCSKVYTNFHLLNMSELASWSEHLDIIGLDIYWDKIFIDLFSTIFLSCSTDPNCWLVASPSKDDIKKNINDARQISGNKPVLLAEVGYNSFYFEGLESEQADWVKRSTDAAIEAGAIGYFYWTISDTHSDTQNMGLIDSRSLETYCNPKLAYDEFQTKISSSLYPVFPPEELRIDDINNNIVTLKWSVSSIDSCVDYRIFYREKGQNYNYNNPVWQGTQNTATIYGLNDNTTYYFVSRAIDINGNQSCSSNEVCWNSAILPTIDSDSDGLLDSLEYTIGTDPFDKDTDDDGLIDGNIGSEDLNVNGIVDPGETDPNNPDTDGDGIFDGTEKGLTEPETEDTDLSAGHFIPDADPSTTTDPTNPDTDGDGISDGDEDLNRNGSYDPNQGETDPSNPEAKICSILGNDPKSSIFDQDIFKFQGAEGEEVTITLEPDVSGSYTGERATLILKDRIRRVRFFRIDRSALPNTISATLPATGKYRIIVSEQPRFIKGKRFRGDYCLTLESSEVAWQTLEETRWVE